MHHYQRATARMKAQGLTVLVRTIAKLAGSVLTRSQVTLFVSVSDKTFCLHDCETYVCGPELVQPLVLLGRTTW